MLTTGLGCTGTQISEGHRSVARKLKSPAVSPRSRLSKTPPSAGLPICAINPTRSRPSDGIAAVRLMLVMSLPDIVFAQAHPAITSFTPSSGPVGTVITVTGSGFTGATYAKVSYVTDAGLTVISDTQATITVPFDAPNGAGKLAIGNPTYLGYSNSSFTVTVSHPVITSFTPASGPVGTVITVTGSGFAGATYAKVSYATDAGLTVVSDTQAKITVPADAPVGAGKIAVGNPSYLGYSNSSFTVTVPPPLITSFTPTTGPVGTVITVTGNRFTGATYAKVSYVTDAGIDSGQRYAGEDHGACRCAKRGRQASHWEPELLGLQLVQFYGNCRAPSDHLLYAGEWSRGDRHHGHG